MILNQKDQKICDKYSAYDNSVRVHCWECPLIKGDPSQYDFRCKANSHYNRKTHEWEYDENEQSRIQTNEAAELRRMVELSERNSFQGKAER